MEIGKGTYGTVYLTKSGHALKTVTVKGTPDYSHYKEHSILHKLISLGSEYPVKIVTSNVNDQIRAIHYYMKYYAYTCASFPKDLLVAYRDEIVKQLLLEVDNLQRMGIEHRDIKTTNVLINLYDSAVEVKLVDFSLSKANSCGETIIFYNPVSPPEYNLIPNADTQGFDIWSLGVLFYHLFTLGKVKIYESTIDGMISKLYTANEAQTYKYTRKTVHTLWDSVREGLISQSQFDLVRSMTHINPKSRPSAYEILNSLYSMNLTKPLDTYLEYASKFTTGYRELNPVQVRSRLQAIRRLEKFTTDYNVSSNVYFTTLIVMDEMIHHNPLINTIALVEASCLAAIKINEYLTICTDEFLAEIHSTFGSSRINALETQIFCYIGDKLFPLPNYIAHLIGSYNTYHELLLKSLYTIRRNYTLSTCEIAKLCLSLKVDESELSLAYELSLKTLDSSHLEKILLKNNEPI